MICANPNCESDLSGRRKGIRYCGGSCRAEASRLKAMTLTTAEVKNALHVRHGVNEGEWVCIEEAFSAPHYGLGGGIDLFAIGARETSSVSGLEGDLDWPTGSYEVKSVRSDFRAELRRWPTKARLGLQRAQYFVFAIPAGMLTAEEIACRERPDDDHELWLPPEAGLVEVDESGCHVRVPAPRRWDPWPLTVGEAAQLIRRGVRTVGPRGAR